MADRPSVDSQAAELAAAFAHFRTLLDRDELDALQPHGPTASYTTGVIVWLLVYQRLHANASLAAAVADAIEPNGGIVSGRQLSANTGAYSRARQRLKPEVAEQVADRVFESLLAVTPPLFAGRRAFVLDGTTLTLAPTPELRKAYPPATNQHGSCAWPVALAVVAHELASGCALRPELGPMYGPHATGELHLALRILARLPARSLLLADRNFGVFAFVHAATSAGHDVLTRLTEPRFHALLRSAQTVAAGEWTLDWTPSPADRRAHPTLSADARVRVRLIERTTADGKPLWLLTTADATADDIAATYRRRLDVETDIRDVKITLKTDDIRARSVAMLVKELTLGTVAYNLVVQVRRLAAQRAHVQPRCLSFAGVWTLVQAILLRPTEGTPEQWAERFEVVLRGAAQRKVPNRPGRNYPRLAHARSRKFPSKPRPETDKPQV